MSGLHTKACIRGILADITNSCRVANGRDVGNAACFLASDEADFITGIELPVDGGRALQ